MVGLEAPALVVCSNTTHFPGITTRLLYACFS